MYYSQDGDGDRFFELFLRGMYYIFLRGMRPCVLHGSFFSAINVAVARVLGCKHRERRHEKVPTHTFRTGKGDEDIEDILARVPISARSWFIKEALRFQAGLGGELKRLNENIESLNGEGVTLARPVIKEETTQDDMEDMLAMGIADLLK